MAEEPQTSSSTLPNLSDEQVDQDAIELVTISTFNGLCRVITALAENGFLTAEQLAGMHEAMTTPLDDPDLRDDDFITLTRDTIETVLAAAVRDARDAEDED